MKGQAVIKPPWLEDGMEVGSGRGGQSEHGTALPREVTCPPILKVSLQGSVGRRYKLGRQSAAVTALGES